MCGEINRKDFSSEQHYLWVKDGADSKRYDFPLDNDSIVFDVGGYKGEWALEILKMYGCNIYIFEPVKYFYHKILNRFWDNPKIKLFNSGLSDIDRQESIYLNGDATSIYVNTETPQIINLIGFNQFIEKNSITCIDLLKLNIEGEEYRLLKAIIEAGNHTKIKNILVQFHDYVEYYDSLRDAIHNELKLTHDLKFNYPFIWECWELKK